MNTVSLNLSLTDHSSTLSILQTLTTLHLQCNHIGDEGAEHLASALQVNTVSLNLSPTDHSSTLSVLHRHSQRWILKATRSEMMEHNIWQVHCKWILWDLNSLYLISHLISSLSHRHSQHCILHGTRLAMKEHSTWQVCCKWTQWDSTSLHIITHLISSFHIDTHNSRSLPQRDRRWRGNGFGQCIAIEHCETRLPPYVASHQLSSFHTDTNNSRS